MNKQSIIQVFEHQRIRIDEKIGECLFTENHFNALELFFAKHNGKYYSLGHKCIQFTEYVGAIQVGNLTIEVLPKIDKYETDKDLWHGILLDMLKTCRLLLPESVQHADLRLKANSILELYFELFLAEMEYLLRSGLIKKYRKQEGSVKALKGALVFSGHIRENIIHKERFYTRHAIYDPVHRMHQLLYECLLLIKKINTNASLDDRVMRAFFDFPEMPRLKVCEQHFEQLPKSRKTAKYQSALQIAQMLLLNYHPDIRTGKENVIALMFDMNRLWEEFIFRSLKRSSAESEFSVHAKKRHKYWFPGSGYGKRLEPDILIRHGESNIILDTKWKTVEDGKDVGEDDLRQLFVYNLYFDAAKAFLV
ncbi:MAG TPA: hypothetical protein VNJ07_06375, partial [Chitinophagales bacterium]|nr:hypothetical protein [Chitinophagales bacterium]